MDRTQDVSALEKIVREYIDKSVHMSLATVVNNKPWVSEVHFVYDDNLNLYWRSLSSRRHSQEIAVNPNVAGSIVKQHQADESPHGLFFEGLAQELTDKTDQAKILSAFQTRLGADASILEEAQRPDGHKFYKVTIETWYAFGKFGGESSEKYVLPWSGGKSLR